MYRPTGLWQTPYVLMREKGRAHGRLRERKGLSEEGKRKGLSKSAIKSL